MTEELTDVSILQLTQKERPADRFLASNVHQLSHGRRSITFISVVEILDAWNPARELGISIPQTFIRLFTTSEHQSILTKFEDALKGINKLLADARIKSTSPVNCALTLVADDEVYLASVGQVGLLLLRNGRVSHLSADAAGSTSSNEFTTVTSGELTSDDWLFVANMNLGHLIEDLPVGELSMAATTIRELERYLEQQMSLEDRRTLAGCVIRYSPEQSILSTLYLDEVESRTPINLPKFTTPRVKLPSFSFQLAIQLFDRLKPLIRRLSARQWALAGIGLVVIVALIIGITRVTGNEDEANAPTQTLVSQMAGLSAAEIRSFIDAEVSADAFSNLSSADQSLLRNMITAAGITLTALPKEVSTLPNPIVAIDNVAASPTEVYAIDSTGQLWRWQNQQLVKIEQKQLISQPTSLAVLSTSRVVVSDAVGNIWLFDGSTNQPQSLTLPTTLATGKKIVQKFGRNLYLFNSADNQVYRVTNFDKDLNSASVLVRSSVLSNAPITELAINGDIWSINAAGSILGLRRNSVLPAPNLAATSSTYQLAATETELVVATNRLLTNFDIATSTTTEAAVLTNDPVTDIAPNATEGWWLAIDSKLYLLP